MKHWIKKFLFVALMTLCGLALVGCNTTTTSQKTTKETKSEKKIIQKTDTLEGTWELVDAPITLQKSMILRESNIDAYPYILEDFAKFNPKLIISGDSVEFKYSLDYTTFFDHLYDKVAKNVMKKEEYYKAYITRLKDNASYFKVTKMKVHPSKAKYTYSLPDGKLDVANKTISFKETPSLLINYSFGTTNLVLDKMTYQYEWKGDTLILTAEGNTENGTYATMKMTFKKVLK